MIRDHLIKALYENLLGPKLGHDELIEEPFLKYELGILNSSHSLHSDNNQIDSMIDSEINPHPSEIKEEGVSPPTMDNAYEHEALRQEVDSEINLKLGMCSLGLSFVLEGKMSQFKICLTWARYRRQGFGTGSRLFQRCSNFYVTDWISPDVDFVPLELKSELEKGRSTDSGGILHVLRTKIKDSDKWIVKIFFENRTEYDTSNTQKEKTRIFQSQIRVKIQNSKLVDLDTDFFSDSDDDDLLYQNSRTKARGFLCAAVWNEVDSECNKNGIIGKMSWPDSSSVPKNVSDEFLHPDIRTEYIPLYAILQPDQSQKLAFDASQLSQVWDPDEIDDKLKPIVQKYSTWINKQRQELLKKEENRSITAKLKQIGEKNLDQCDNICQKIDAGIEFLKTDEKARIAFCFMNVVMNDKRYNEEGANLSWREFQMAFMLQCLRGIADKSKEERNIADVLWFPTGGGKTEAYLGLVIFCIAYRRLLSNNELNFDGGVSVISRYTLRLLTIQQFQRSLGAIVAADIKRVENWAPNIIRENPEKLDPVILEKFQNNSLWGEQRFSIGMWIGGDITPKEFPYTTGKKGKKFLNCEGALLPSWHDVKRFSEEKGDPAQIQKCPICQNILCLPRNSEEYKKFKCLTWIIKSPKSLEELQNIPKKEFESENRIVLCKEPIFQHINDSSEHHHYYRLTMDIKPALKNGVLDRDTVDSWWKSHVQKLIDPNINNNPLESTRPSMPGYFFLQTAGSIRPHDFALFCTNPNCKLNKTKWFEKLDKKLKNDPVLIPKPFQSNGSKKISNSVPISAFTYDEQVYYKCPSFVISTVDKFANLPFEPRCASLFGNVDVIHKTYGGYGRDISYIGPIQWKINDRKEVLPDHLEKVRGFYPPSLILQDELHLIEGQLGSMMGVYEMAIDVLSDHNGSKPKYIASSATIKEAKSQVGTIFRRDITIFPPSGIDSSNNYFSEIEEDVGCTRNQPGRVYLGISTSKSTVFLPIKAQSIIMSEIFKIKSCPSNYNLTDEEIKNLSSEIDPYWTFVSYFTDLQLLSKFTNYYPQNVMEYVQSWSRTKIFNSEVRASNLSREPAFRLFPVTTNKSMTISSISTYCGDADGKIKIAIYEDGVPIGKIIHKFDFKDCRTGENIFELPKDSPINVKQGDTIWIGLINEEKSVFESVFYDRGYLEDTSGIIPDVFPDIISDMKELSNDSVRFSLNTQSRPLNEKDNIQLSSATKSEEMPKHLERLKQNLSVDSLQTSPVFGTGIDIDRLGIMQVMNQPKTNSGYIQSSGRVGRIKPGLIINWLRAGRARDLNHYENFLGYHRMLHRFVEPITASPFSYRAMELCLGPILVSILRNACTVLGTPVNSGWVKSDSDSAAFHMVKHNNDPEVKAISDVLKAIVSVEHIAKFRRMSLEQFDHIFNELKSRWHNTASWLQENKAPFEYAERNPNKKPEKNVVLGSPNHAAVGLDYVYGDTPNSLRQTESTAVFYRSESDTVQIRPSQFITRYGPGALISEQASTWVIPPLEFMISNLQDKGNFSENLSRQQGLYKYEINDSRMKRILHRLNPKIDQKKLKLFSLPTNSSLDVEDSKPIFKCKEFPKWAICYNILHPSKRFLIETSYDKNKLVVRCPECQHLSSNNDEYSTEFYNARYVIACKKGHLDDVDWPYEVHKSSSSKCRGNVFEWITSGSNDNAKIICLGHWDKNNNSFVNSTCKSSTSYIELKTRSKKGTIHCTARFAESGNDFESCPLVDGLSQAKLISKTQMSIRMPVITTTMEIQSYKGILFESYYPIAQAIVSFKTCTNPLNDSKEDFIKFLKQMKNNLPEITNRMIEQTRRAYDSEFCTVIEKIIQTQKAVVPNRIESLTELKSLEEELSSLENLTRDNGKGAQVSKNDPPTDINFPIKFRAMNLNFEAMPFEDIKVTQVQSGYTREIVPPQSQSLNTSEDIQSDSRRIGDIVHHSEKYRDENDCIWYLADQLKGEGIFIHLDPEKHKDAKDIFKNHISSSLKTWNEIYKRTKTKNDQLIKRLKNDQSKQQHVDALELEKIYMNPIFVWWHSFVHELINQLSIDSGFMGVSLGERIYCVKHSDGTSSAGIFIYAALPGTDGTLGGLTSLVDENILPSIIKRTLDKIQSCSNDPICSDRKINRNRKNGAACHVCLLNSETSCAYQNKFLDRNIVLIEP